MSIITLTTDLGIKDHYVSIIKGEIYKQFSDINIVDISNEITKFDIQEAAFVFKNSYKHFRKEQFILLALMTNLVMKISIWQFP